MENKELLIKWIEDGKLVEKYYKKKISKYSINSVASLDWRTEKMHKLFFDFVFGKIDINSVSSLLDIGCGNCRVIKYLASKNFKEIEYEGVDIVKEFVVDGQKKYKNSNAKIINENFLSSRYKPWKKFDLVLNLGGLNSKVRFQSRYLEYNIKKMILCSKKYVVFNVIINVDDEYFKKSKKRKIGSIFCFSEKKLIFIINKIAKKNNFNFKIEKVSIFDGSIDAFVFIELI